MGSFEPSNRELMGRALMGQALIGRALVGRALMGRALTGRALMGRALMGPLGQFFVFFPQAVGPKQLMSHPHMNSCNKAFPVHENDI